MDAQEVVNTSRLSPEVCKSDSEEEVSGKVDVPKDDKNEELNVREEVFSFDTDCDECSKPSKTRMKVTPIPHFKEVVIMATECEYCGHKTNEVKSCGGIEPKGKKFTLRVQNPSDLTRDVLKTDTCSISIPELELDIGAGVFVGKFTTVEGVLRDVKEDLSNPMFLGDSSTDEKKDIIGRLVKNLEQAISAELPVHLILDDPTGGSYIQSNDGGDSNLKVETYSRTKEQNDDLGINDMVLENYEG